MARERSIVVRLKAEVAGFNQAIQSSARTLSEFEREQQKMGGAATTTMGRLVQSAQINEREWATVGRTLTGIGAAITGVGVAALKTGIEYNTLQQTSRAALTTITGSAEAANSQMDKLDAFARTSPFAKQVFIQAQQQMLGFGIEARKVIPYMDAIQNAVAATGGSNQDIAELATVFSQVHANAKITARELMMFGQRGVDAATIIGSQMGKTGQEIRAEITAGTLDAGQALDALAAGMQENFGGAAANIKNTIDGAFDRVKAAWRDLSSELAAPLVGPEGGGLLVGWLNSVADAMRSFQAAPGWLKGAVAAIGGLTGVVTLGGGALLMAAPKYFEFRRSIEQLSNTHPMVGKIDTAVGKFGRTVAIAAASWAVASVAGRGLAKLFTDTAASANELEVATRNLDFDIPFAHMASGYNDFESALRTLTGSGLFDKMDRGLGFLIDGLTGGQGAATLARQGFEDMGNALQSVANSGDFDEMSRRFRGMALEAELLGTSSEKLLELMPTFRDYLIGVADAAGLATDDATLLKIATGELTVATDGTTDAIEDEVSALEQLRNAHREAADATLASLNSEIRFRESIDRATEGIKENGKSLDLTTEKGRANQSMLNDLAASGYAFVDSAKDQEAAMQEVRDAFIKAGQDAGMTKGEVSALADELGLIPGDYVAEIEADDTGARATFGRLKGDWETTTTVTQIDANPRPAEGVFADVTTGWEYTSTPTNLDLNPTKAEREFASTSRDWTRTTTDTNLGLRPTGAVTTFNNTTRGWRNQTTNTNLGLNTSGATAALNNWKARNNSFTVWANVQTRGGANPGSMLGKYRGGKITAPGLNAGGKVPGPRASYDNVLWPLSSGGRTLTQPLSGGEWVINSAMSQRYDRELASMNAGTYPSGGSVSVSLSDRDVARIAAAVREGASVGTRAGFGDLSSGARLSGVVV